MNSTWTEYDRLLSVLDARLHGDLRVLEETMYRELGYRDERIGEAHRLLIDEAAKLEALRLAVSEGRMQSDHAEAELAELADRVTRIERDQLVADSAIELLRANVASEQQRTSAIETARAREFPLTFARLAFGFLLALAVFVGVLVVLYVVFE